MLTRDARDKALPFAPFEPNETTVHAMTEARARTGMSRAISVAALLTQLDAEGD